MLIFTVRHIIIWLALGLGLTACAAPPASPEAVTPDATPAARPTLVPAASLPDMGAAPPIENEVWLNSEGPLSLPALRGKVVLIEFWTFG